MVAREGLATDHGNNYVVRLPSMTSQASSAWPVFWRASRQPWWRTCS